MSKFLKYHLFCISYLHSWVVENKVDPPHLSHYCTKTHEVPQSLGPDTKLL